MMAEVEKKRLLNGVVELTKAAQERDIDPLMWSMQLSSSFATIGLSMPSIKVAELLVSHIYWSNNVPIAWKYLDKALTFCIVPPMHVLALLSTRVVSKRSRHPTAYRLYMELLKRYVFSLPALINGPNYRKMEILVLARWVLKKALFLHMKEGFSTWSRRVKIESGLKKSSFIMKKGSNCTGEKSKRT